MKNICSKNYIRMGVTLFICNDPPLYCLAAQGWKVPCGVSREVHSIHDIQQENQYQTISEIKNLK